MLTNAFISKPQPSDEDLAASLGATAKALWDRLVDSLVKEQGIPDQEWNSYSPKAGWALRLKKGKRNIVYLSPSQGAFTVSFILGDKAVTAARESRLPAAVIDLIDHAKRYPEGTAVRLEVHKAKDLAPIETLTAIKLSH